MAILLPAGAPAFYPPDRIGEFSKAIKGQLEALAERVQQHAQTMSAAVFTTHPLWAEAKWNATTFTWHPTSDAPPIMGLVFDDAAAGKAIFREVKEDMNQQDRFEEIRVSIVEGDVAGQERRPGYSVHLCPDPESLAAHATLEGFVLNPNIVPLLGQWNRHYPIPGNPPMLPRFKREFEKHGEFMLAPVTRRADGQLWCEHELGIIKYEIHFRDLLDIAPDDPDAAALTLPQLITPLTAGV